jgi:predicted KAP-like P-loop ATPase
LIKDDRPIKERTEDKLGFRELAKNLSTLVLDDGSRSGLVFGIEGEWGSGKSSILNLLAQELSETQSIVVSFAPWQVGDSNSLIANFFDELSASIEKNADRLGIEAKTKDGIKSALNGFGTMATGIGGLFKMAGGLGIPLIKELGQAAEFAGKKATKMGATTLSQQKEILQNVLSGLDFPIIVTIDDLDRLEPTEVAEIMRLVKAVGDLPNIIYVLSYDPTITAQTLEAALKIKDGYAFLEKVVQASFRVPIPEYFDLRRWFTKEMEDLFFPDGVSQEDEELAFPIYETIRSSGQRYLRTPRDVVRAINAIRMHSFPVKDKINPTDLIWLQLVRLNNTKLYLWIEEYITQWASISDGNELAEDYKISMSDRLHSIISRSNNGNEFSELQMHLPGLSKNVNDRIDVFSKENTSEADYNRLKHLGSPEYFRNYFSFTSPTGILSPQDINAFMSLVTTDKAKAINLLEEYLETTRPQGGNMASLLISKLASGFSSYSSEILRKDYTRVQISRDLLQVLASKLDATAETAERNGTRIQTFFDDLMPVLNYALPRYRTKLRNDLGGNHTFREERQEFIKALFSTHTSPNWLRYIYESSLPHSKLGDDFDELFPMAIPGLMPRQLDAIFTPDELTNIAGLIGLDTITPPDE